MKHRDFILSDISQIVQESIEAVGSLSDTISSKPLDEFIFQTILLRLSGCQEQKLKCIMWELATEDYDLRYKWINGHFSVGECSHFKDKNEVYKLLQEFVLKINKRDSATAGINSKKIFERVLSNFKKLFEDSALVLWRPQDYSVCIATLDSVTVNDVWKPDSLLAGNSELSKIYDSFHTKRNQCAHNLLCVYDNLPDLEILGESEYLNNYFFHFFMVLLIDEIFRDLFRIWSDRVY